MNEAVRHVLELKGSHVETVGPGETVLAAVEQMNERRIGALLVVDDDRPIGMFTERDVLTRVVAKRLDPERVLVRQVMSRPLITIPAHFTVTEAMVVVTDRRCRHLPVIDGNQICGLVSSGDLTSWLVRDQQRAIDDLYDYMRRP
jgi:CBS domain-containing protein